MVLLLLPACEDDQDIYVTGTGEFSSDVVLSWVDLTLKMSRETPGFSPPVTARAYGYSGLALYEAVRHANPEFNSLEGQLTEFAPGTIPEIGQVADYHWGAVANATLGTFMNSCFRITTAENMAAMAELEQRYEDQFRGEAPAGVIDRSVAYGRQVGNAVITYANTDGQEECYNNNFPASYVTPTGEGLWVSVNQVNTIPLQPYWGSVRPFLQANVTGALPVPPPAYSTDVNSEFYAEAMEVYEAVVNVTDEQRKIAEFWSDDPGDTATPPGHSYSIMLQILRNEETDLFRTAEVYAKLGIGVHDAFISCWNAKYHYNLVRPITYVHDLIDPTWDTPLITPPFPEYTSGHSVQSGAVAQILTDEFGDNYAFNDSTHIARTDIDGTPRPFNSFYHFADEAAISRLYGGIHFRSAIDVGVEQGIEIGRNVAGIRFK